MNDYRETQRAHDEYAQLTGKLVHTCTITNYDPRAKAWIKRTVEYIDIGRPDAVMPVDSERNLEGETLPRDPRKPDNSAALKVKLELAAARHAEIERLLIAYLKRNGPCNLQRLAFAAGKGKETVRGHLAARLGTVYCQCPTAGNAIMWGLVGIHDREAA